MKKLKHEQGRALYEDRSQESPPRLTSTNIYINASFSNSRRSFCLCVLRPRCRVTDIRARRESTHLKHAEHGLVQQFVPRFWGWTFFFGRLVSPAQPHAKMTDPSHHFTRSELQEMPVPTEMPSPTSPAEAGVMTGDKDRMSSFFEIYQCQQKITWPVFLWTFCCAMLCCFYHVLPFYPILRGHVRSCSGQDLSFGCDASFS